MENWRQIIRNSFLLVSFLVLTLAYNNCGSYNSGGGDGASTTTANSTNGDIIPIPNTKTASVQRASRVLDNLVSCLGTVKPSSQAKNVWETNRGTISEEGLANSMTQPMAKSLVSVSAEVCDDLIDKEKALEPEQRRIFLEVDFSENVLTSAAMRTASKRLARSCWGRNATDDELNTILSSISSAFSAAEENRQTMENKLVYMCTAMAASFSTYEM